MRSRGCALTCSTGSDLRAIKTNARRDGDHYVINGSKTFISNGTHCDLLVIVAKTDTSKGVVGLIEELRTRFPDLNEDRISDLALGCVTPVGDQGMDIARTAVNLAKLPDTVGGMQLNRFCGSGLDAINVAAPRACARASTT